MGGANQDAEARVRAPSARHGVRWSGGVLSVARPLARRRAELALELGAGRDRRERFLIGVFVDLLLHVGPIRHLSGAGLATRTALLVGGTAAMGLATALYIGAGIGRGRARLA